MTPTAFLRGDHPLNDGGSGRNRKRPVSFHSCSCRRPMRTRQDPGSIEVAPSRHTSPHHPCVQPERIEGISEGILANPVETRRENPLVLFSKIKGKLLKRSSKKIEKEATRANCTGDPSRTSGTKLQFTYFMENLQKVKLVPL